MSILCFCFHFCAGFKRAIPSGQVGLMFPAQVANQSTGFASYRPKALPVVK